MSPSLPFSSNPSLFGKWMSLIVLVIILFSIQEKGKVSFEEFGLDAERRAHGMRFVPSLCTDMCCVFLCAIFTGLMSTRRTKSIMILRKITCHPQISPSVKSTSKLLFGHKSDIQKGL